MLQVGATGIEEKKDIDGRVVLERVLKNAH
jgi:hypothetical protein